jgi:hypothetical protein
MVMTHTDFVAVVTRTFADIDPLALASRREAALASLDAAQATLTALPWHAPAEEFAARLTLRDAHVALVRLGVCAVSRKPFDSMRYGDLDEDEMAHIIRALDDHEYLMRSEHDRIVTPWFPVSISLAK